MKQVGSPSPYKASEAYRHPRLRRCFGTISLVDFSPNRYGLGFFWAAVAGWVAKAAPITKLPSRFVFLALGLDGWSTAKRLGSRSAPFMFAFWAPGWDGWAGAGLPLSSLIGMVGPPLLGRMGGPLPTSRAPVELPSCFLLSGLLGRMGGPRPRSWARIGLPSYCLSGLLGRMGGPRPRSWARTGLHSYCLSGLLGRMGGPRPRSWAPVGLPSCFLLSGSWVGWVGRGKEAGL